MAKLSGGRPSFREWIDKQPNPDWGLMPLTHITKGIGAEDIVRAKSVNTQVCEVFDEPLAYFFYGRPAYRIKGDGTVKVEAACPYCFIFDESIIHQAKSINAFDTGAFAKRMLKHYMMEEMNVEDFALDTDVTRPNKLIRAVYSSRRNYFDGDSKHVKTPSDISENWEFHARAYLQLITSTGRNEPDDRIASIEIVFGAPVPIEGNLRAVVVPHTLWDEDSRAPWLEKLQASNVEILPYFFVPGKHPDHYHALLEVQVRELYERWGII